MGVSYVTISLFSTVLSYGGLHCWTTLSPEKLILDGLTSQSFVHSENVVQALESVLDSYTSIALVANFTINIFVLVVLSLKVTNLLLLNLLITDTSCSNNVLCIQNYLNEFHIFSGLIPVMPMWSALSRFCCFETIII